VVSTYDPRHVGVGPVDGHASRSPRRGGVQKKVVALSGDEPSRSVQGQPRPPLPLSVPEVRRLLWRLVLAVRRTASHILAWSQWRRRHQTVAQYYHDTRREAWAGVWAAELFSSHCRQTMCIQVGDSTAIHWNLLDWKSPNSTSSIRPKQGNLGMPCILRGSAPPLKHRPYGLLSALGGLWADSSPSKGEALIGAPVLSASPQAAVGSPASPVVGDFST
jgi:hypothetical protein